MGQSPSVELQRREAILSRLIGEALRRCNRFRAAAEAEKAAGLPAAPGSSQALYQAAQAHWLQLTKECGAINIRLEALKRSSQGAPMMPEPTPPWEEVEAALAVAEVVAALAVAEPSTPDGSSPAGGQRGSSSDESAAAPAGEVHASEAAPLLVPGGAGPSVLGLRRRHGREPMPPNARQPNALACAVTQ